MVLIQIMYSEIRNTLIILSCHPPWLLKPFGWFISLSLKGILGLPPHPRRSLSQPGVKSFPTSSGSAPWPVAQGPSHADISRFPSLKNLLGQAEMHSSPIDVLLLPCVDGANARRKSRSHENHEPRGLSREHGYTFLLAISFLRSENLGTNNISMNYVSCFLFLDFLCPLCGMQTQFT